MGRRELDIAEVWFKKNLAINERLGDEYNAAGTYYQIGYCYALRGRFIEASKWVLKAMIAFDIQQDIDNVKKGQQLYLACYAKIASSEQVKFRTMWEDAGFGDFPQ